LKKKKRVAANQCCVDQDKYFEHDPETKAEDDQSCF